MQPVRTTEVLTHAAAKRGILAQEGLVQVQTSLCTISETYEFCFVVGLYCTHFFHTVYVCLKFCYCHTFDQNQAGSSLLVSIRKMDGMYRVGRNEAYQKSNFLRRGVEFEVT